MQSGKNLRAMQTMNESSHAELASDGAETISEQGRLSAEELRLVVAEIIG